MNKCFKKNEEQQIKDAMFQLPWKEREGYGIVVTIKIMTFWNNKKDLCVLGHILIVSMISIRTCALEKQQETPKPLITLDDEGLLVVVSLVLVLENDPCLVIRKTFATLSSTTIVLVEYVLSLP